MTDMRSITALLRQRIEFGRAFPPNLPFQPLVFGASFGLIIGLLIVTTFSISEPFPNFILLFSIISVTILFYSWNIERRYQKNKKFKKSNFISDIPLAPLDTEVLKFVKTANDENFNFPLNEFKKRKEKLCNHGLLRYDAYEDAFFLTDEGLKVLESPSTYYLDIPSEIKIQLQKATNHQNNGKYEETIHVLSKNIVEKILKEKLKTKYSKNPGEWDKIKEKPLGPLIDTAKQQRIFPQPIIKTLKSFNAFRKIAEHEIEGSESIDLDSAQLAIKEIEFFLKKVY